MKKVFLFIICLIPWFLSNLLPVNFSFYNSLNLPFFAPPSIFFAICWSLAYIGIACSTTNILDDISFKEIPSSYKVSFIINYIFNQSFIPLFFMLKSPFLGFVSSLGTFISLLFLYEKTYSIKESAAKYLNFYLLLSLFGTILSITIYLLNIN